MSTKKSRGKDYITNKEMLAEVLECQRTGVITDKLGKMFILMANRYATKPNFSGYSYIDEMISAAIVSCIAAVSKFDASKSDNTFAYYTSVIHNAFLQVLNRESRQREIRDKILVDNELDPSYTYQDKDKRDPYEDD